MNETSPPLDDDQSSIHDEALPEKQKSNLFPSRKKRLYWSKLAAIFGSARSNQEIKGISRPQLVPTIYDNYNEKPGNHRKLNRRDFLKILALSGASASSIATRLLLPNKKNWELARPSFGQSEKIKDLFGFNFEELAKKNGFEVKLAVEVEKGQPYIIHIGQQHQTRDLFRNSLDEDEIISVQQNIYNLLKELTSVSQEINAIGLEGLTPTFLDDLQYFREVNNILKTDEIFLPSNPEALRKLRSFEADLMQIYNDENEASYSWVEKATIYAFKLKLEELMNFYHENPTLVEKMDAEARKTEEEWATFIGGEPQYTPLLDQAQDFMNFLETRSFLASGSKSYFLSLGGGTMLYIEGSFGEVILIEDPELMKEAGLFLDELYALNAITSEQQNNMTEEELRKLQDKVEQLKKKSDSEIFEGRESAVLTNISRWITDHPDQQQSFFPIVYGAAHDFENNVRDHNSGSKEPKFGLITLTPQELIDR